MSSAGNQFDLFDEASGQREFARLASRNIRNTEKFQPADADLEVVAQRLEASGDFRVLRKLVPRKLISRDQSSFPRLGVLVDTETTGLSHQTDEVIEVGAVAFTFNDDGQIGDVIGIYSGLSQPSAPIPPEITRLTGITDEMVLGHEIDIDALDAMIEPADLVIAHNAAFDRPFCETLSASFIPKAWACSVTEVPWADLGFEGSKLGYLIGQSGYFHEGHRATDDCHALLEVLARRPHASAEQPFAALLRSSAQSRVRVFAENSPFDMKDHLKARGYHWSDGSDGRPKAWWIEVADDLYDQEIKFLRTDIYRWDEAEPLAVWLGATDRFRR